MWAKAVIIALVMLGAGGAYRYSGMPLPSFKFAKTQTAAAAPAAPAQQRPGMMTDADQKYLVDYMNRIGNNPRAYREGVTVQNISLPSGKPMKMTITKTNTGYCPKRRENLYHTSISVSE